MEVSFFQSDWEHQMGRIEIYRVIEILEHGFLNLFLASLRAWICMQAQVRELFGHLIRGSLLIFPLN